MADSSVEGERSAGAWAMPWRSGDANQDEHLQCNAYGHVSNCRGLAQLQDEDEAATTSSFSASIA